MANAWDNDPIVGGKTSTPAEFAQVYGGAAKSAGKALGIDPNVIIGQWGLETGWGKSIIPGTNNLGNIKDFSGSGVAATDNMTGSKDKYRSYATDNEFVKDYVSLIKRKYPGAQNAGSDPAKFTAGMKGYAEDPRYAEKVAQASRMAGTASNPLVRRLNTMAGAVLPSANAAEVPTKGNAWDNDPIVEEPQAAPQAKSEPWQASLGRGVRDVAAGALNGAGSIGSSIMRVLPNALGGDTAAENADRRSRLEENARNLLGADTNSWAYKSGKLGGEIAGTAGAGGLIAKGVSAVPMLARAAPNLIQAIQSSGMTAGGATGVSNALTRAAGGAITGGVSAGMVDPKDAATGAAVGGAMPGALKVAGTAGRALGSGAKSAISKTFGTASPEVTALADRAQQLGIDIPADRLLNSKPLNALAATLNYVPLSGRAGTEELMTKQLNTALSKTFGQNTDNVTHGLRTASSALGSQFDTVLQNNTVKITPAFKQALQDAEDQATSELGAEGAGVIHKQIAQILAKGTSGEIEGQAAYNIKKALDRIGNQNSPTAFYARDLKKGLMNALNDSLGPTQAAEFATLRKQYGNMMAIENIAQNGAEGGVSIARLANMKNIGNNDLQELADISAQFLKTRESPHGALQRLVIGSAAAGSGGLAAMPYMAGAAAVGRGANMALNSKAARALATGQAMPGNAITRIMQTSPGVRQFGYRAAPVLAGDR